METEYEVIIEDLGVIGTARPNAEGQLILRLSDQDLLAVVIRKAGWLLYGGVKAG